MTPDDKTTVIPIRDTEAWKEGYAAGRRGLTGQFNPHPVGSIRALSWQSGLAQGRKKQLDVVK
jgi:hypothetical protein